LLPAPIIVIGKSLELAHNRLSASSKDVRGEMKYSAAPPTRIEVSPARDTFERIGTWV